MKPGVIGITETQWNSKLYQKHSHSGKKHKYAKLYLYKDKTKWSSRRDIMNKAPSKSQLLRKNGFP